MCVLLPYSTAVNTVSASGLGTHRIISLLLMACFPGGQKIPRGVLTDSPGTVSYTHLDVYKRQGLGIAVGACLALKRKDSASFVYNLLSDGELNEGSTWEAVMSASHWKLDNLIAIVDVNNQQADGYSSEILSFEPIVDRWQSFGWFTPVSYTHLDVYKRQGHDRSKQGELQ